MASSEPTDGGDKAGLGGGAIASLTGLGVLVIFMLQNRDDVTLKFLVFSFSWPIWLFTLVTALFGALVWFGLGVMRRHRRRKERRADRRDYEACDHMGELEDALTITASGDGGWQAFADPRFVSINAMFGGWTAAITLRAAMASGGGTATPSATTVNFIERVDPGTDVSLRTRRIGGSRSITHWQTELTDAADGRLLALAMSVLTDRRDSDGLTIPTMPHAPDPESLDVSHAPGPQGERSMIRAVVGQPPFGNSDTRSVSWVREMTGRRVDHLQLAFLADQCAPRSWFWSEEPRLSATLTMSVYFHATAEELAAIGDDYILNEAVASRGASSTADQQVRMWSRQGHLLSTSEQLCWYR